MRLPCLNIIANIFNIGRLAIPYSFPDGKVATLVFILLLPSFPSENKHSLIEPG
jgi:hypothetical protein